MTPAAHATDPSHLPTPPIKHQECLQSTSCAPGKPADQVLPPTPRTGVSCRARLLLASTGRGRGWDGGQAGSWANKKKQKKNGIEIKSLLTKGKVAFSSFSSRSESGDTAQVSRVDKISQWTIKVIGPIGQSSSFKVLNPVV